MACNRPVLALAVVAAGTIAVASACGSSAPSRAATSTVPAVAGAPRAANTSTTSHVSTASRKVCGNAGARPDRYRSVVVFAFENRTWSDVGTGFGPEMPYLHGLGRECSYFTDWTETDTAQNSLTQYVGQVTGAPQPGTVNDCSPSSTCSTTADNIFRQARRAGLTAINYVEGATGSCSADGNAAKHVPALYLWGGDDRSHCQEQVRPLSAFNPNAPPAFAFITPTLCNDGHDCGNAVVDRWAKAHVQPVLESHAYAAGKVAVFIWYDEDHPVPNLWIAPTARGGARTSTGAGYAGTLKAWESMLGLPCLERACAAPDMRVRANA